MDILTPICQFQACDLITQNMKKEAGKEKQSVEKNWVHLTLMIASCKGLCLEDR